MRRKRNDPKLPRESVTQALALVCLLAMGGWALAGPSGLIAWTEAQQQLEHRRQEIADLTAQRDQLRNRVGLLDPTHADADLAGELLRRNLNVAHPDEMVMLLK